MLVLLALACAPPDPVSVCPEYSGFTEPGRTWTWRRFADDAEQSATLLELSAAETVLQGDTWTEHYACDADGLWAVSRGVTVDGGDATWDFDPPYLVMPAFLDVGTAWSSDAVWHYADSTGTTETASRTEQVEVVAQGESNVSAGAFSTLELHRLDDSGVSATEYRAADVGLVLDDEAQLMAFEAE